MDIADMADKFIEDQVLSSVMKIRAQGVARDTQGGYWTLLRSLRNGHSPRASESGTRLFALYPLCRQTGAGAGRALYPRYRPATHQCRAG